ALRLCRWPHHVERGADHGDGIDALELEPELSRSDAVHVEEIVDELDLELGVALDRLDRAAKGSLAGLVRAQQHAGPPEDRRHGRAQLVAYDAEEIVLGTGGGVRFARRLLRFGRGALRLEARCAEPGPLAMEGFVKGRDRHADPDEKCEDEAVGK